MNHLLLPAFLVCTSLVSAAASPPSAPETTRPPIRDALFPLPTGPIVAKGMSREHVAAEMGRPDAVLGANLWVFWIFRAKSCPEAKAANTLLVVFKDGRVDFVRLTTRVLIMEALRRMRIEAASRALAPAATSSPVRAKEPRSDRAEERPRGSGPRSHSAPASGR